MLVVNDVVNVMAVNQPVLQACGTAYTIWLSAEAIDLGRPYWILYPVSCHTQEAATAVSKCSWGWRQKASETCRVILQLLINILPSCITLVLYIYYWPCYSRNILHFLKPQDSILRTHNQATRSCQQPHESMLKSHTLLSVWLQTCFPFNVSVYVIIIKH